MYKIIMASVMAAVALPAMPAMAQQQRDSNREYRRDVREAQRDYRKDVRDARKDRRQSARDWRQYKNYDWNRPERGQRGYSAERYYREGSNYKQRRLSYNDRIYRGNDGRYYCRRNDGTTGLIIGAAVGGLLGNQIDLGGSSTLRTVIGAGAGGLLGREIGRGGVSCR